MHALALFAPVAALMVILPGPDFVQISRISLAEGRARGQAAALGVACGIVVHTTAAVIGLTAVIAGSPLLFGLLTYAGTAYLGWIGVASIRHGLRMAGSVAPADGSADETAPAPVPAMTRGRAFRQGFLTNVLNPKAVLSFLTLLPQFMTHSAPLAPQFLALGGMLALFCLIWFSALAWLLGRIRRVFSSPVFQRRLHLGAGCVFLLCAALLCFFHAGRHV
ncbi:LysE family translocator [uncultured Desulfovibrio sp.]|uniref:LysE family translocator n=1 Tax=uncultured Desulfovibrio sp. TaxID=167968 RepID=UPI0026234168|nr:LysE family translocator [uncultured Desulfovibrio sp.]